MKKIFILVIGLLLSLGLKAQQDALYSQYMFNPFSINPAYAGSRNSISAVALHRSQWIGIEGAPMTQSFSVHTPSGEKGIAFGLNFVHDHLGPTRNMWGAFTGAYHVKMKKAKLAFALRGGFFNSTLDRNLLTFENPADQFNSGGKDASLVPSFDFGAYYYRDRFYAGLSVNHLTKHNFDFSNYPTNTALFLNRHYMLMTGTVFKIRQGLLLKPSLLFRYAEGGIPSVDVNFSALVKNFWWIGASFRNKNSLVFLTEFNVTDYLRIGYSFDLTLNKLRTYNNGSHELFIGFDFTTGSTKNTSPRYL
jgi:type IX secretion system PorP/SprF family membrane protein